MSRLQYYPTKKLIDYFLEQGKEGVCWDFKQEWHSEIADLVKDIICFANTVHDENCYLIFGVSNDLQIKGMQCTRRKQADIIDTISNLHFAGDNYPKISVETISYSGIDIDVLIIYNTDMTPIYLKKHYGKMQEGCIYLRIEDKNTPNNGNADIIDIENLWKKRLGLTKTAIDYIYDHIQNKFQWIQNDEIYYNIFKPEYTIEIQFDNCDQERKEFYSYAMTNDDTLFGTLNIKYQQTILESIQIAELDGGRFKVPLPEWGFICHDEFGMKHKYSYKYYILQSKCYHILKFLYDQEDSDQRYAFSHLKEVILFYLSEDERVAFEVFLESHQELVQNQIRNIDRFNYVLAKNEEITALYKERLHVGVALNILLKEWRKQRGYNYEY